MVSGPRPKKKKKKKKKNALELGQPPCVKQIGQKKKIVRK